MLNYSLLDAYLLSFDVVCEKDCLVGMGVERECG